MTKKYEQAPAPGTVYIVLGPAPTVYITGDKEQAVKAAERHVHLKHDTQCRVIAVAGEVVYQTTTEDDQT